MTKVVHQFRNTNSNYHTMACNQGCEMLRHDKNRKCPTESTLCK